MNTDHHDAAHLPDLDHFEQQVNQADLDRDPFAIALFEVKPDGHDYWGLYRRLARSLGDFASPTTHVANLGHGRMAVLARTTDTTHQWIAPIGTALRATLDAWLDENGPDGRPRRLSLRPTQDGRLTDLLEPDDDETMGDQPRLISGAARGLTRAVWSNAEAALAEAAEKRLSFVEHNSSPGPSLLHRRSLDRGPLGHGSEIGPEAEVPDDERLAVLAHRVEPVDRPEPEWLWLRLGPGLDVGPADGLFPIERADLSDAEQAMLEVWLVNQVGPLFAGASAQLRVTVPITAEAARARSFAQRIFPVLERHRIPPSRLVLEIDGQALVAEATRSGRDGNGSQPSIRRFVEDAAAMNVAVVINNFDGGWAAWRAIDDLPVGYIKPLPELLHHAGLRDDGAIRLLGLIGIDADNRGIELIVPAVETALSPRDLALFGFAYQEGPLSTVEQVTEVVGAGSSAEREALRQ